MIYERFAAHNKRQTAARGLVEAGWFHVEVLQSYVELVHSLNGFWCLL